MKRLLLIIYMYMAWAAGYAWAEVPFVVFTPIDATQGLSGNQVRNITQLPDGRMLITTAGQFNLYDGTGFTYLHYKPAHICTLSAYAGYHHEYIDNRGYVWMKNWHKLMAVDITNERMLECPDSLLAQWGVCGGLKDFFMDREKNLWPVTEDDELLCIDGTGLQAKRILTGVSSLSGREEDSLYDLAMAKGKLYLFYRSGALLCYDLVAGREEYRKRLGDVLPDGWYGHTSYVVADDEGFYQLCNGWRGGVLLRYDYAANRWTEVLRAPYRLNYISPDRAGNIWLSCLEGLWFISSDLSQKYYIPVLKLVDGRKIETEVSTLYNDACGGLWVGTLNRGMLYYHPGRFRFRNIGRSLFPVLDGVDLQVTGFRETDDHQIWVETTEGVFCYTPDDVVSPLKKLPSSVSVTEKEPISDSLLSALHRCNDVCVDKKRRVWMGQEDGLVLWNRDKGIRRTFYTADGLVNNAIRSLIATSDSTLWVATANGLSCLTVRMDKEGREHYSFANFNQGDGVIANEFCSRSVFQASDGTLYWGGINGFNSLYSEERATDRSSFIPLFVGFILYGKRVETGAVYDGRVILERPLAQTEELVLEYGQNFFSLEFSALNYINPTQTYYRYCLEGVDKEEQVIRASDGRGRATYTDVPPGTYRFRVQASRNGEVWLGHYAGLLIIVKPPFWQTPWAYVLYVLVITGVVLGLLTGYLRYKKRCLVREQKEKLDEMKGVFLQNINQELQAPVKKMLPPLDEALLSLDEGKIKHRLQVVRQEAAGLESLIGQLAEGVLLPLPTDEKSLDLNVLLAEMRRLLKQQEERKRQAEANASVCGADDLLSESDEAFIRKALHCVERHLDDPAYSVEAWSRDMGMERSGLYRKLVAVVGKTPTNFIRSVRLKEAARLLEEGYTVAEVADMVGFSTANYLSRCFYEEFGMRPTQYLKGKKKH